MQGVPAWFRHQSGVIPYRQTDHGIEVLLVTSRKRKRWIIPKGVIEPELTAAASAVAEAWEEAGIRGWLHPVPVGHYRYRKWQGVCEVEVYLMSVEQLSESWPECDLRQRHWFPYQLAAKQLNEPALSRLVGRLPRLFHASLALSEASQT
jgi:8-oxo-dGTP pyrophosphatase MutT (NUDIX family)